MYFQGGNILFLRLVDTRCKPEALEEILNGYESIIIPRLETGDGCLFAGAVRSERDPESGISMTLKQRMAGPAVAGHESRISTRRAGTGDADIFSRYSGQETGT